MTTAPTPSSTATNLNDAIATYSSDARTLYDDSHAGALARPGPGATDEQKAAIKAAQSEHAAAFSQLATAASMESEQVGRAGYAAVVRLMQVTADAADKVSTKLVGVLHAEPNDVAAVTDYQLIASLTEVLRVLAELSPSQVWTGTSQSGGG